MSNENVTGGGVFKLVCRDAAGNIKWEAESHNLVVNGGLKSMNDTYFLGSGYTATWFLGLYGAAASNNPAATDTAASHPGWTEVTAYSNGARPTCSFAAASNANPSVITNSASAAVFLISGTATIGGAFLISDSTIGGSSGTLFSAVDFASPGDRMVVAADTLTLVYTFTYTAT